MQTVDFKQVEIRSGFFRDLQTLNAEVSVYNIYKRFQETGRFHAMKCIRDDAHKPHVFWDSDIAKWLESVANILAKKQDAQLKQWADEAIADICSSQLPCGYFNSYFQVYEPENIFQKRPEHELYCAGHLIEAAVALHEAGVDVRQKGRGIFHLRSSRNRTGARKAVQFDGRAEVPRPRRLLHRGAGQAQRGNVRLHLSHLSPGSRARARTENGGGSRGARAVPVYRHGGRCAAERG